MPQQNPVIDTILSHRSIRQFSDREMSNGLLKQLIQCGQAAATSSFIQACSVVQVTDEEHRALIAEAAGGQQHIINAPTFLVFCADMTRINHACVAEGLGELEGYAEHFVAATVDVALMAQNVLLAAESMGLGGVYIGGLRNDPQVTVDALALPEHVYPVFGLCLGWPAQDPEVKPRFPVEVVLHKGQYNAERLDDDVARYNQTMQDYYQARSSNNKVSTWTEQTAAAVQKKKREHMLSFLQGQGYLKR